MPPPYSTPEPLDFRPGDVLLYTGNSFMSLAIRTKTWSWYSHCEVYDGCGMAVASRDGLGVDRYPLRLAQLTLQLRPKDCDLNLEAGRAWFETVKGQGYDWLGLFNFASARRQGRDNKKMFCSEFAVRQLRAYGCDPFNNYDADGIAPGEMCKSSMLPTYWKKAD